MSQFCKSMVEQMVERVSWMSPIDYEILHLYEKHDIQLTPKVIAANIEYDRSYTGKRCRELRNQGLLQQTGGGLYSLTEAGRRFLAGDLDPSELEDGEE